MINPIDYAIDKVGKAWFYLIVSVAAVVACVGIIKWHDAGVIATDRAQLKETSNAMGRKAKAAAVAVPRDGAADRLQREFCPSCSNR